MKYNILGSTDLKVSKICLGTMTWGRQNTEQEAHEQLDYAFSRGINFIDTAEMYAVPASKESQGLTERYIGSWLTKNQHLRKDLILATKVTGPSGMSYISDLPIGFSKERIKEAIEGSLQRLKTDYVDLYQLHWPERKSNMFGQRDYKHWDGWEDNFLEILHTLTELKTQGKIRHYGLSNETSWGVMKTAAYADTHNLERFVSIQNSYSLLNRTYEYNLSEVSQRENIPLLAYSPLAMGLLSGKYLNNANPKNARLTLFNEYPRFKADHVSNIVERYAQIAKKHSISLTQMSLSFVNDRPFVGANIIGATTMDQLKENIDSIDLTLSNDVVAEINKCHNHYPNPTP